MLPRSLLVITSALAVASASPVGKRCDASEVTSTSAVTAATATTAADDGSTSTASPTLPSTGGTSELPAANGTLVAVAVGHGIQNYTCSAAGVSATSIGALAVLYDITSIYSSLSSDEQDQLPISVLRTTDLPLNLAGDPDNEYAADAADPWKADADITVDGVDEPLSVLGHHFFDAALTPTFDLYNADDLLFKGAKLNGVKAPASADPGLLNTSAVDWLQLGDKGASIGLTEVYRVVTAGGGALACEEAGQVFSVPYASQYWFYDS
ncbi:mitogen activated protein kinase 2 [Pestalotiopsis sp. IQ-011]